MMMSKAEARKKIGQDSGSGKLLSEIEAISRALHLDKTVSRSSISTMSSRSKSVGRTHLPEAKSKLKDKNEELVQKDKKSIWGWKALKAFTNVRNRRFNCSFSLHVHSIEGLPPSFDDLCLCVHWKRRDGEFVTRPARVFQGIAEFEERLTHMCSVYGSRSGPHHSAKYEAKHFLLYASVFDAPELDLGKHRVDLTRLLPLTLEELEEEKNSGKWMTSFRLLGKAKGATMNVSFGYLVLGNNSSGPAVNRDVPEVQRLRQNSSRKVQFGGKLSQSNDQSAVSRAGSLPPRFATSSRSVENIKDLHEVLPITRSELSASVNILYQKLDEDKLNISVDYKPAVNVLSEPLKHLKQDSCSAAVKENVQKEYKVNEISVRDHGMKLSMKEEVIPLERTSDDFAVESPDLKVMDNTVEVAQKEDTELHGMEELKPKEMAADGFAVESHLSVMDSTIEVALKDTKLHFPVGEIGTHREELVVSGSNSKESDTCTKESLMKELDSALNNVSDLVKEALDSQEDESEILNQEICLQIGPKSKGNRKATSLSSDDVESVANEFLDMLGIDHSPHGLSSESDPESPRERLLRQFEKDALAQGCSLFNFGMDGDLEEFGSDAPSGSGWATFSEGFDYLSTAQASDKEHKIAANAAASKTGTSMLEDLETEALMHEWGLNEKDFQSSPPNSANGFGSPIDLPPEDPMELPSLGEGLGPYLQTKNGGFLRSMNPVLFKNAKSGGSLIMQVSSPVVVPAEMGSGIIKILQRLASVGIEKLSMQANKLMPLEDITGKTMQQIAWDAAPSLEAPERQSLQQSNYGQNLSGEQKISKEKASKSRSSKFESSAIGNDMDSEYVSLEALAPLAMDKIEALSIEGLRIQSGMSGEDEPSNISPQSIGEFSALEGKMVDIGGSLDMEGAGGLQLLDIKDNGDDVDGLMGLSLTLDEWLKLDSGDIYDDDQISERTSKILAAHHATYTELIRGRSKGEKRRGKSANRKCGLLGNNFTVALMVQLRDPLRNYEPVGTPMLALIQVERVFVPPKPKIYSIVSELRNSNEEEDESEPPKKEDIKEDAKETKDEGIPQFRITEVHVAGLKAEPGKKKLWGSTNQQQSGSRWLLANGMGKKNKVPFMKSKAVAKTSSPSTITAQPGDTLWSISSRVYGTGAKWKELAALNPHIRNPNIILPDETIRLR